MNQDTEKYKVSANTQYNAYAEVYSAFPGCNSTQWEPAERYEIEFDVFEEMPDGSTRLLEDGKDYDYAEIEEQLARKIWDC